KEHGLDQQACFYFGLWTRYYNLPNAPITKPGLGAGFCLPPARPTIYQCAVNSPFFGGEDVKDEGNIKPLCDG
ncbi:hypothetical protein ACUVPF_005298, partial [Escherichia coli]